MHPCLCDLGVVLFISASSYQSLQVLATVVALCPTLLVSADLAYSGLRVSIQFIPYSLMDFWLPTWLQTSYWGSQLILKLF